MWSDSSPMPLPLDPWHAWYEGQPENDNNVNCAVITNFKYWAIRKVIMPSYSWLGYTCDFNGAKEIQGYICERRCYKMFLSSIIYVTKGCLNFQAFT